LRRGPSGHQRERGRTHHYRRRRRQDQHARDRWSDRARRTSMVVLRRRWFRCLLPTLAVAFALFGGDHRHRHRGDEEPRRIVELSQAWIPQRNVRTCRRETVAHTRATALPELGEL